MFDVALARCRELPDPDPDEEPLLAGLARAGIPAKSCSWDDPRIDWSSFRVTLLRATWNYAKHHEDFLRWAEHVAACSVLANPLDLVRWNTHKQYLLELAANGIPVVPTELLRQGASRTLQDIASERGWEQLVIKPAISAGSYRTALVTVDERQAGQRHLDNLLQDGDALVQPYLESVADYGERALVHIEGELTHGVRKSARFGGDEEVVSSAVPVSEAEAQLAQQALAALDRDDPPLYARVDVAPGPSGAPLLMELELVEPSLFFAQCPHAVERLVGGLQRRYGLPA